MNKKKQAHHLMLLVLGAALVVVVASAAAPASAADVPLPSNISQYRLTASTQEGRGRLEVQRVGSSEWGTVCSTHVGPLDALAVCKQLGFNQSQFALRVIDFGGGSGPIYDLTCDHTNEYQVCNATEPPAYCSHDNDVGIDCQLPTTKVPRVIAYEAVTTYNSTEFVSVLASKLYINKARIIVLKVTEAATTNTIEYRFSDPPGGTATNEDPARLDLDYIMRSIDRDGMYANFGVSSFTDNTTSSARPSDLQFRLVGGSAETNGRLETRPNASSSWGSVCSDNFDQFAAIAACKSLGLAQSSPVIWSRFGGGSGAIYLDDVDCLSTDQFLQNCSYVYTPPGDSPRNHDCVHAEDVGIDCRPLNTPTWQFRLADGNTTMGRLELRPESHSSWGSVCDDNFDNNAALAACHSLGFTSLKSALAIQNYGGGTGSIYMDDVTCNASTFNLTDCTFVSSQYYLNHNCRHYEDVGVDCNGAPQPDTTQWEFRITGDEPKRGRFEMRPSAAAAWGTICDDGFDSNAALAACHSLGYTDITFALAIPYYGGGSGTIYVDDTNCTASDQYLQNCSFIYSASGAKWHNCIHYEDVGIDCTGAVPTPLPSGHTDEPTPVPTPEPTTPQPRSKTYSATIDKGTFSEATFKDVLANRLGVSTADIHITSDDGSTVKFYVTNDQTADSDISKLDESDYTNMGVTGMAPVDDGTGKSNGVKPWVIGVIVGGVALLIGIIVAVKVATSKSAREGPDASGGKGGEDDYIAMSDYRPPEV